MIGIWFTHYLVNSRNNRKPEPEAEKEQPDKRNRLEEPRKPEEIAKRHTEKHAPEIITAPTQREVRSPTTVVLKKPVEKKVEVKAPQQVDNRIWWNKLDSRWKNIFKKAVNIDAEPSEIKLLKIVQLRKLGLDGNSTFRTILKESEISSLEPLRQLTNLQELSCSYNQISDLEPLRQLTNLQKLNCSNNKLIDLEPLCQLTNLQELDCSRNQIIPAKIEKFKKAVPNCEVKS